MISDPTLFVDCDLCECRVDFDFSFVLKYPDWQKDARFDGWEIDWNGMQGDARCPKCKHED